MEDQTALQQEMDSLAEEFSSPRRTSMLEQYAFTPAHPKPIAYLTENSLHGGWLHLINLWLAGAILEDTWGRVLYPIIYLVAGAAALQFHAWLNHPSSIAPTLGALGASGRGCCAHGRVFGALSEKAKSK